MTSNRIASNSLVRSPEHAQNRARGGAVMGSFTAVLDALRERDLDALVTDVAARRGVPLHDLCSRGRSQSVARARHEVWWRIRHHPERHLSLLEIARLFGRDHSTIKAGIDAHARRLAGVAALEEAHG